VSNAILSGGGPYTFDCDGPTTLNPRILSFDIEQDVALDGEGRLTLAKITVGENAIVELRNMTVTGRIENRGTMTLEDVLVTGGAISNEGAMNAMNVSVSGADRGIDNAGTFMAENLDVSNNTVGILNNGTVVGTGVRVSNNVGFAENGHGIGVRNVYTMTLTNCTISGNTVSNPNNLLFHSAISNLGVMTLAHCSIVGDGTEMRSISNRSALTAVNTVIEGGCTNGSNPVDSRGYNIESPRDTCRFDEPTDQVNVTAEELALGPLEDNGGWTQTHALLPGSIAIDVIPGGECLAADGELLTTDQRGEPRPAGSGCDVGAFEVQP
jgi:hypothetical protein